MINDWGDPDRDHYAENHSLVDPELDRGEPPGGAYFDLEPCTFCGEPIPCPSEPKNHDPHCPTLQ